MVYIIKATGELPLPSSPLTGRPSENIVSVPNDTGRTSVPEILIIEKFMEFN